MSLGGFVASSPEQQQLAAEESRYKLHGVSCIQIRHKIKASSLSGKRAFVWELGTSENGSCDY
jgi:hypothetical protein